ncbi:hypothetical protein Poli38472_005958 [Pythium oligandrum]|uniref:mRNA cap-binding protein n=1 Tax=Pythium oligandrum TaxID=41045 RepID=A0A8K1FLQ1_PYTOL|nr:hypothetical protein Poli38472_005958 [Pythium oligandrum]|eukprot:TMW68490.1 hypothetical protein Poli38472_005958 [Pythium oligandrum]
MSAEPAVQSEQTPVEQVEQKEVEEVVEVPREITTKHPLQHRWTLWYDNPKKRNSAETWEENLKNIFTFDTVEDFWCLYNNVLTPTKLSVGSNYHLFKEGIRPMWEDPINAKGGKWIFTNARSRRARLDECWLHVMLSLIGESLHDEDDICGAVVSVRKAQDRIAIWSATAEAEDLQKAVGRGFRNALIDFGKNEVLKYQSHADAAASGSSFQNEVMYEA